jgi:hypothetical protein
VASSCRENDELVFEFAGSALIVAAQFYCFRTIADGRKNAAAYDPRCLGRWRTGVGNGWLSGGAKNIKAKKETSAHSLELSGSGSFCDG